MPTASEGHQLVVCCLKWGERYADGYVDRLRRAVADHLQRPHRFVCFTDEADELGDGIEVRPLPDIPLQRNAWNRGIWPKLGLFAADTFEPGTPVLYLDLDVLVLGDLERFTDRLLTEGGLHIIREWNPTLLTVLPVALRPDRGGNSSVVAWIAGEQSHIFDRFCADPDAARASCRNDQQFISLHARGRSYWPHRWCGSFKRHCVWYWPLSKLRGTPRRPDWCSVLVFHGKPDPSDLIVDDPTHRWGSRRRFGYGPVVWVQDYWRRYGS
ncbi:MAG: hypothetical protein V2I82_15110 [Halieaceae bacterium]|jgi:hypothetical protein|nr:hypothetical protein [Halieaceae bacterium]